MTQSRNQKRLARQLAEFRGCAYTAALNELRGLPAGTSWTEYVADVVSGVRP